MSWTWTVTDAETGQVADELVHLIAENLRGVQTNFGGTPRRIVTRRKRNVQETFRMVARHVRVIERHDGMLEVAQVDHRHLAGIVGSSTALTFGMRRSGDHLHQMIQQFLRVEARRGFEVFGEPFLAQLRFLNAASGTPGTHTAYADSRRGSAAAPRDPCGRRARSSGSRCRRRSASCWADRRGP